MRTKKAILNIIIALLYELFLIVMGIIIPKLIIRTYGSDVNGLTSTINNVLSILNLIQAGAVGASIFQMFKPVAERDYEAQGKILGASILYFRKVGLIFLILVAITAPILALSMASGDISFSEKVVAFLLLGLNGSLSFFFISHYDILFSSNQNRFILSFGGICDKIIYYSLLLAIIFFKLSYLLMYAATILGTFFKILLLYIIYRKTYANFIKFNYDKSFKIPNKGYLMLNQIARQSIDGSPTIILSVIGGLGIASVYSVYSLVFNMIKTLSSTIQTSISEVFGNVVVSDSKNRIKTIYDRMNYVFFAISLFLCCCMAFLFKSFIYVYTDGNSLDINYLYDLPTILFAIYGVIFINYHPIYTLTNVLGFYKDTYFQSVITAVVSIAISIGLSFINWSLVIVGLIFYFAVSYFYRTYIVFRKTKSDYLYLSKSIIRFIVSLFATVFSWSMSYVFLSTFIESWLMWLLVAVFTALCSLLFIFIYSIIFEKNNFLSIFLYMKSMIRRKKNENISDRR
ncbi:MAG: hypothetical protein PUA88_07175 [Bacillales bacterium]|nr:hypothetical protein [Bacillales bacterium]